MSGGRDRDDDRDRDRDPGERPRKSWREIDRARDGSGHGPEERRPRGAAAEARSRRAAQEYMKQIDGLFAKDKGGAEGEGLARAIREARDTSALRDACTAYRDAVGLPRDPALLSLFLETGERELVLGALGALAELRGSEETRLSGGLRSQVRLLSEDADDAIAEAAEALLDSRA